MVLIPCLLVISLGLDNIILDGEKGTPEWANAVQNALGDGYPVQSADWVVFYNSTASEYQCRNGKDGTIDDQDDNAQSLIQRIINDLGAWETLYVKGSVKINAPLTFNQTGNYGLFRFFFDNIEIGADCDGLVFKDIIRSTVVRGLRITCDQNVDTTGSLLKLQGQIRFMDVFIGGLHGDNSDGQPVAIEIDGSNATDYFMHNHIQVMWDAAVQHALKVDLKDGAWASVNKFNLGYCEGVCPRQIYIKKTGSDGFHHNIISMCGGQQSAFNPQSLNPVYTIKLETDDGGAKQINSNTFRDLWVYSAVDEIYRADSGVWGTRFVGGMPRTDLTTYWHDGGTNTEFVSTETCDTLDHISYSKLTSCGQNIEHHTVADTLVTEEAGTIHTNLGASGNIKLTLPQDASAGTQFEFVVMAAHQLQVDPGAAGAIYVGGDKQTDDAYIWADDEGESVKLVADGNGDWVALYTQGVWTVV